MTELRAVVFDWRGTLVTTLDGEDWVRVALRSLGRDAEDDAVAQVLRAIVDAFGEPSRLDAPDVLMVGDRPSHDGAAIAVGMPVLLIPPLTDVNDRRLHHVGALLDATR